MKKYKDEIYVVKKEDTLSSIATAYGVNPVTILVSNNCTPKMIKEGLILYIKH